MDVMKAVQSKQTDAEKLMQRVLQREADSVDGLRRSLWCGGSVVARWGRTDGRSKD